jgi:hypothetical protein
MRDKKNVDDYKASIKAQLSRAGLIRGQPRHNPIQAPSQRSRSRHVPATEITATANNQTEYTFHQYGDAPYGQNHHSQLMPGLPGASNSTLDPLTTAPYVDVSLNGFDPYSPSMSSSVSTFPVGPDALADQFPIFAPQSIGNDHLGFLEPPSAISPFVVPVGQTALHEELVMHYFDHVCKMQFTFAGEIFTNVTYTAVMDEPRGAVTHAICALADLHSTQMRVSQGLEAPNPHPETSTAMYLRHEALFKLESNKEHRGGWSESDAIAALHLVSFSQLSGRGADWETPFDILCQWLLQTGLPIAENPRLSFPTVSPASQLVIKAILWFDIFSSLSLVRPPKFTTLWKRLLDDQNDYWGNGSTMDMQALTGCPNDAMLAIADISALAHWKSTQQRNGTLSFPELVRRGNSIEQHIRRYQADQPSIVDSAQGLPTSVGTGDAMLPTDEQRILASAIFRETSMLYLHTILSTPTPGVPEISSSVDAIVHHFTRLSPSNIDRALVFPICLAGCMTNDSTRRDFLKGRFRGLNESYGNLLQTRLLMEAVWQKRDVGGEAADLRETIREQGLQLLLL